MSISQMAILSGFSRSYVSQVERDLINPTLGAVKALADSLGLPVASFFESDPVGHGSDRRSVVLHPNARLRFEYPGAGVKNEILNPPNSVIEFVLVTVEQGGSTGDKPLRHAGEECAFVLRGELELTVGDEQFTVRKGDSFCFPSTTPHSWQNVRRAAAELVFAITPPSF